MAPQELTEEEFDALAKAIDASTTDAVDSYDAVSHPSHYIEGRRFEPIEVIEDWELDFCCGNALKYISRAGRKESGTLNALEKEIQDLEKAKWYIERRIKQLTNKRGL